MHVKAFLTTLSSTEHLPGLVRALLAMSIPFYKQCHWTWYRFLNPVVMSPASWWSLWRPVNDCGKPPSSERRSWTTRARHHWNVAVWRSPMRCWVDVHGALGNGWMQHLNKSQQQGRSYGWRLVIFGGKGWGTSEHPRDAQEPKDLWLCKLSSNKTCPVPGCLFNKTGSYSTFKDVNHTLGYFWVNWVVSMNGWLMTGNHGVSMAGRVTIVCAQLANNCEQQVGVVGNWWMLASWRTIWQSVWPAGRNCNGSCTVAMNHSESLLGNSEHIQAYPVLPTHGSLKVVIYMCFDPCQCQRFSNHYPPKEAFSPSGILRWFGSDIAFYINEGGILQPRYSLSMFRNSRQERVG